MGGMDGKVKKILNYLKKNGDVEVDEIAFPLKMDEDFVQNALDTLRQDGLVASSRNGQGKVIWSVAADGAAPAGKPAKKGAGAPEDDEFVLEDQTANIATETIAASFETVVPPKAAPMPAAPMHAPPPIAAPAPVPVPVPMPAPAPVPAPVFAPVPVQAPAHKPVSIEEDFSPKGGADEEDFSPKKEKKAKKEKPPKPDIPETDDTDDAEPKAPSAANPLMMPIIIGAVALILIIIVMASAGGSGKKAIAAAENAKTELTGLIDVLKAEHSKKIEDLEAKNKAMEDKISILEAEIKKLGDGGGKAPAKPAAKKGRR
jgi:cell division protein FtsB/DNA-binding transcriptional ArsR family regulator